MKSKPNTVLMVGLEASVEEIVNKREKYEILGKFLQISPAFV